MVSDLLKSKSKKQTGLLIAAVVFALLGVVQLWQAMAGRPVTWVGHAVPLWAVGVVGMTWLSMSVWMSALLNGDRPDYLR